MSQLRMDRQGLVPGNSIHSYATYRSGPLERCARSLDRPRRRRDPIWQASICRKGMCRVPCNPGGHPRPTLAPTFRRLAWPAGPFLFECKCPASNLQRHFTLSTAMSSTLKYGVSQIPRSMIAYLQAKITDPASVTPETHMPAFHMSQSDLDDVTTALLSMSGPPICRQQRIISLSWSALTRSFIPRATWAAVPPLQVLSVPHVQRRRR